MLAKQTFCVRALDIQLPARRKNPAVAKAQAQRIGVGILGKRRIIHALVAIAEIDDHAALLSLCRKRRRR